MTLEWLLSSYLTVYDGRGTLEEGETAETRFIKIQAAYELLIDKDKRKQYDIDNLVNPMKVNFRFPCQFDGLHLYTLSDLMDIRTEWLPIIILFSCIEFVWTLNLDVEMAAWTASPTNHKQKSFFFILKFERMSFHYALGFSSMDRVDYQKAESFWPARWYGNCCLGWTTAAWTKSACTPSCTFKGKKKKQMDIKWSKTMFFICGIDYLSKYKLWMYFLNIFSFRLILKKKGKYW